MRSPAFAALALLLAVPAHAQTAAPSTLRQQVEAVLAAAPAGTRFGVLVVDDQGREVLAINPDQRFMPASNTKLFTTALAFDTFAGTDPASMRGGTSFTLIDTDKGSPDLRITGEGGVALSTSPRCQQHCLAPIIEKLAASTHKIGNVIADDSFFVDQHWSPGMSWNNIQTDSGTGTSALLFDDNEVLITVTPGKVGAVPAALLSPYFTLRNEARTVAAGDTALAFERAPNSREVRLFGTIAVSAQPWRDLLGVDDPAHYAAWATQQALLARGVKVSGKITVVHRAAQLPGTPEPVPGQVGTIRATFTEPPVPLAEEVAGINKPSQNLHAEALFRRAGIAAGVKGLASGPPVQSGTRDEALQALQAMLDRVGAARTSYDFSDGSGMSSYNRVSPRTTVALLRWGAGQPWGGQWRASFPVGGVDGTLKRRFLGTPLQGKVFAKTGTLNATNALSGYLTAASGRTLTFAFFANDVPGDRSAARAIDDALGVIAAAN